MGIVGLVYEPIKSAQKYGIRGIPKGIGKGLVGLLFKPLAGSIDVLTYTYRGVEGITN